MTRVSRTSPGDNWLLLKAEYAGEEVGRYRIIVTYEHLYSTCQRCIRFIRGDWSLFLTRT